MQPSSSNITVEIISLSNSGDGVARVDNKVVFVPFAAPGDLLEVEIVKEKKSFAIGRISKVLTPSENRVPPRCSLFGECGGCQWQHISYDDQLMWKQKHLEETLQKIGGLDPQGLHFDPMFASPSPFNYRNRIQGDFRGQKFFFHKKGSSQKIQVSVCDIAHPLINHFLKTPPESSKRRGKFEISQVGNDVTAFPVDGKKRTTELGFRQVNSQVSAFMTETLFQWIHGAKPERVNDLYCGRGQWTRGMAQQFPETQFLGIDSLDENIHWAQAFQKSEPLNNLNFVLDKVENALDRIPLPNSFCIVDPPRAGLAEEVTAALCKNTVESMTYISCHPATLARDLKTLCATAYEIQRIQPMDMFPQTPHLETMVLLRGKTR